ncbi:unnamed protein product [Trifolium pratense]|uniref:Uncharacterized protein n=1 Tax=Trifolium pratense TaxID=57577 RepID=A0ACB0JPC6_TRIPR|nr:unnamed protein product [Trifolium pratense]
MEPEYSQGSTSCCFCFSTKKGVVARNNKSREVSSSDQVEWKKNDEILLSDMTTFSVKEQEKRLKKALEEEKKVSIEAERVVQWVKHESSRIDTYAIKSILSDNKEKEV